MPWLSDVVGRSLRLPLPALEQLSLAALLHDVGKIATPDHVLLMPTALDDTEHALMQQHPERRARMLAGVPDMEEVAAIIRHHHEHWDGSGYPEGIAGEFIPLASRIIHLTDAYDAMTSPRPFREAFDHARAVARLREMSGRQFDPDVCEAFCGLETLAQIRGGVAAWARGEATLSVSWSGDPRLASRGDLVRLVMREPALALSALREVNGDGGRVPVTSLAEACKLLGEDGLRALAARHIARAGRGRGRGGRALAARGRGGAAAGRGDARARA